jgi:hypothetical protein
MASGSVERLNPPCEGMFSDFIQIGSLAFQIVHVSAGSVGVYVQIPVETCGLRRSDAGQSKAILSWLPAGDWLELICQIAYIPRILP